MKIEQWLGENNELGKSIFEKKYAQDNESFDQWIERISNGNNEVAELILQKKFLFGGRILANRGLQKKGKRITYSNCYVISPPEDNIESIFDCAKKLARTYSYGGGCGINIGNLSPKGATINNAAKETTGAVSFMDLYSTVTGLIGQSGRRGALMLSIPCNHPDLLDFIHIKDDLDRVTKANISVCVTEEFMEAVKNKKKYMLSFTRQETGQIIKKEVDAYSVFMELAKGNWNMAEPGILFWDRIENYNLLANTKNFKFAGVNPCAEEPLPAGGSCLLASLNLDAFVDRETKTFSFIEFEKAVKIAITALNEVLDEGLPLHPLEEQRQSVSDWRQCGLGIMAIADMLIHMEIKYGSKKSIYLMDKIARTMINAAMKQSAILASKYGAYRYFNYEDVSSTGFYKYVVDEDTDTLVKKYGLRNSQLLTIAPTGSISTMLGVSGGIEPIFANSYERRTISLHKEEKVYKVYTKIVEEYMNEHGIKDEKDLPDYFVTAQTLDYRDRIEVQSIWQKYIDASISSTVNVPNDFTIEQVKDLYLLAYEKGLKGVTIFRDGCARAGILTTNTTKGESVENKYDYIQPVSRKALGITHGDTYCKKCACGTLYITVNKDDNGNIVECFVHTSKGGICQANIGAVNRMISLSMRSGVKIDEIIDQLKGINCPACSNIRAKGKQIDGLSCPDIISRVIQSTYDKKKNIKSIEIKQNTTTLGSKNIESIDESKCPECGATIRYEGGCVTCVECGWSKCG